MQQSHYELKLYLKCKCTEHKAKHQPLVRNVAYQQLKWGQIRRSYFVIRAQRSWKENHSQEGKKRSEIPEIYTTAHRFILQRMLKGCNITTFIFLISSSVILPPISKLENNTPTTLKTKKQHIFIYNYVNIGHLWMTHPAAPSPPERGPGYRRKTAHWWPKLRSGKPFARGKYTNTDI